MGRLSKIRAYDVFNTNKSSIPLVPEGKRNLAPKPEKPSFRDRQFALGLKLAQEQKAKQARKAQAKAEVEAAKAAGRPMSVPGATGNKNKKRKQPSKDEEEDSLPRMTGADGAAPAWVPPKFDLKIQPGETFKHFSQRMGLAKRKALMAVDAVKEKPNEHLVEKLDEGKRPKKKAKVVITAVAEPPKPLGPELEFAGQEHIPFGEIVDRPPTLKLPKKRQRVAASAYASIVHKSDAAGAGLRSTEEREEDEERARVTAAAVAAALAEDEHLQAPGGHGHSLGHQRSLDRKRKRVEAVVAERAAEAQAAAAAAAAARDSDDDDDASGGPRQGRMTKGQKSAAAAAEEAAKQARLYDMMRERAQMAYKMAKDKERDRKKAAREGKISAAPKRKRATE